MQANKQTKKYVLKLYPSNNKKEDCKCWLTLVYTIPKNYPEK